MTNKALFWTKLKRVIRAGFFNFWRGGTVSVASVLIMMVTLMVIGSISVGKAVLDTSLDELRNRIDINVSFVTSALESDILEIKSNLESLPEVAVVVFVSRDEALEAFKLRHANDQSILAALDELGENPLGAVLNIKTRDPSQYESVAEFLGSGSLLSAEGLSIIDRVNYYQNKVAIDRLTQVISSADKLGFALTIFFALISVMIAFNTIRLTIFIVRDEINVMRLVGASTTFVQGPFVVVGILYGLVAGVLTLILFVPVTYWLGSVTENFFAGFNIFSYYLRHFLEMFIIVMASGIIIGAFSSILAVRRYLRI